MIKKMLLLALPLFGCTLFLHAAEPVRQVYPLAPEAVAANDAQVKADMQKVSADWQKSPVFYYAVEPMSDIRRLPDLYPVDGRGAGTLDVMAAKGEFEPASFLVYPHQNVDKFELKVSDLKGKKGGVIPASALDLKLVKIWYQCGSAWFGYMADPLGRALTPELLVNDENMIIADATTQDNYARYSNADGSTHYEWISADYMVTDYKNSNLVRIALIKDADTLQPVVLNKNEFKQFMVTIHVPANAEAGIYTGTIDMFADGKKAGTIPVQLGVLPFTLPQARTNYDLNKPFFLSPYETLERSYPDEGILRNLVNHNVTNLFGFPNIDPDNEAAFVRDIKLAKKVGASLRPIFSGPMVDLTVSDPATPEELVKLEALKKKLKAAAEMCKKHLGHTDFYSYAFDEGGYATIKKERHAWHAAHNVGAKVRVSTLPHEKMLYPLDFMIRPAMPNKGRSEEVAKFREAHPNGLAGWYADPHSGPENPDYFRRIHGLITYKYGYDVASNYAWYRNNWNDFALPGESNYRGLIIVYAISDRILDTLAWEGMREGMDDVRYATKLKMLAYEAEKSPSADVLHLGRRALSFMAYWDMRESPDTFRAECINYILELEKAMKKEQK